MKTQTMTARIALLHRFESNKKGGPVYSQHLKMALPQLEFIGMDQCPPLPKILRPDWSRFCLEEVKKSWWVSRHFLKLHRQKPFDLVMTLSEGGWPFSFQHLKIPRLHVYLGCFEVYAEKVLKDKKGYFASRYFFSYFEKRSGINASCISISEKVRREINRCYKIESQIIPVGIDLEQFVVTDEKKFSKNPKPTALFIGQAEHGKGWDIIRQLAECLPQVQFVCVLSQPPAITTPNMIVKENLSEEELCRLYNAADFFIFPSRYESASFVVLEAMACNLPVIISKAVADVCLEEEAPLNSAEGVYVIKTEGVEDYMKAIQTCISKNQRGQTRSYVEKYRSFQKFRKSFQNKIRSIVSKGHL
ncbi:MAG: glycosyltransferase [Deltaproteobacteria bacterium]|nr:glycosyltransferase [Deltaproteobacteria bacterium]